MGLKIEKSKDLRPQCNFCLSKEDVYKIKGTTNVVISICKRCISEIKEHNAK